MTTIRPRIDQIAELTRGIRLPIEPLATAHILVITEALGAAWSQLNLEYPDVMKAGDEPEITSLMEMKLNRMLDPLWSQLVVHVVRGAETVSFDGAHLEKRPDLSIYLTDHDPQFPLVVECKVIDAKTGKDVSAYCKGGIVRFLNGEYAWARSEAVMMAYVRDASSLEKDLIPFLQAAAKRKVDPFAVQHLDTAASGGVLNSKHLRQFKYVGSSKAPGPIAICHVWTPIAA